MLGFVAVLLLAQTGAPNPPVDPAARERAAGLSRRIAEFERLHKAGKPPRDKSVPITESELTDYLNLAAKLPPSLSGLEVHFERERVTAKGLLDLDQLQGKIPGGGVLGAFTLMSGKVQVALKGRLQSDDGFGSFVAEDVRVGSIPISPSVLGQIVAAATRTQDNPQGVDILAPFRYPYGIRQVRLSAGRAVVEF
jgi:hypothetical protein